MLTALCWEFRLLNKDKDQDKDQDKDKVSNDRSDMEIKWTIDTMSDEYKKWLNAVNTELIEDGKKFYEENGDCEWLK